MFNQKEAVFNAVTGVFEEHGVSFDTGGNASTFLTKELRGQVIAVLVAGFNAKTITISKEYDSQGLSNYCSGLLSNWLRKDKRLNGNMAYVAKNPGSRAGSGDPQLKAMRQLLKIHPGDKEIEQAIAERVSAIKVTKSPTIDLSALPEALRSKFGA